MKIRKLPLERDEWTVCSRDVARATRARSHAPRGLDHRCNDFWMMAHTKIVVRAPDDDLFRSSTRMPERAWKLTHNALELDERPVAPLRMQVGNRRFKELFVVHSTCSPSDRCGCGSRTAPLVDDQSRLSAIGRPGPYQVDHGDQSVAVSDQKKDVRHRPHEPCRKACQMNASKID